MRDGNGRNIVPTRTAVCVIPGLASPNAKRFGNTGFEVMHGRPVRLITGSPRPDQAIFVARRRPGKPVLRTNTACAMGVYRPRLNVKATASLFLLSVFSARKRDFSSNNIIHSRDYRT